MSLEEFKMMSSELNIVHIRNLGLREVLNLVESLT